jgi:predicted regulator of Ras-like GTPase activity (Roadblock/LC7/MglB family)
MRFMIDGKGIKAIISKFEADPGTRGVLICDTSGLPVGKSKELSQEAGENVAAYITSVIGYTKKVTEALGEGELNFVKIETQSGEIMIAPQSDFILIVLK